MRRLCVHQIGFSIRYGILLLLSLLTVSCPPPEELDDHGDTPAEATALVVGGSGVEGTVSQGDEDFFWFDGQFGAVYTVATAENGGIQVTVVDDDLQEVPLPPAQKDHEVAFQALWTGRYYVRVGSASAGPVNYQVSAELSAPSPGVAVAEIVEPDSPILAIATDEAGNRVIFHRNLEGADPRASRALTMVSADGMDIVNVHHDEDGLPILMDSNTGYSFVFGNWTETTVDVEVIAPDGTSQIIEAIELPIDQPLSSAPKQVGCQAHPLGTMISIGTFSVGLGSCVAAVAAVASGTLPLAIPLALACGGATASGLAIWAECAGNSVPTYVALAINGLDCLVSGGISCDTFTIDMANTLMAALFEARDNVPPVLDVYPRDIYVYPEDNLTNTITIRNIGGNNLEWEVVPQGADGDKLIISPPSGTTTGSQTIEVLSTDHSRSFSVDILIRNKALENNWFVVTVHVIAVPTDVFVSPIEVILRPPDFTATVEVSNLLQEPYPSGLLRWHAVGSDSLNVTPEFFAAMTPAQNTQQLTIQALDTSENYTTSVIITNAEVPTDHSTVEVSVVSGSLNLSTTELMLTPDNPSGVVRVQNTGDGTLSWSATWSDSALTLDPAGAGPGHPFEFPVAEFMDVTITADSTAFSSGDRTEFVTFSNDNDPEDLTILAVSVTAGGAEGEGEGEGEGEEPLLAVTPTEVLVTYENTFNPILIQVTWHGDEAVTVSDNSYTCAGYYANWIDDPFADTITFSPGQTRILELDRDLFAPSSPCAIKLDVNQSSGNPSDVTVNVHEQLQPDPGVAFWYGTWRVSTLGSSNFYTLEINSDNLYWNWLERMGTGDLYVEGVRYQVQVWGDFPSGRFETGCTHPNLEGCYFSDIHVVFERTLGLKDFTSKHDE